MEKKKITRVFPGMKKIELPSWLEKTWKVLKKIGYVLGQIGKWIYRLRGFFMAIPAMLGASLIKLAKFAASGVGITGLEVGILLQ